MYRNRKGNFYRKIIRKGFALVVLLIGIRLVWVSVVSGWTSDVSGKERDTALRVQNAVRFVDGDVNAGKISKTFEFSEVKGRNVKDPADPVERADTKIDTKELNSKGKNITNRNKTKDIKQGTKVSTTPAQDNQGKLITAKRKPKDVNVTAKLTTKISHSQVEDMHEHRQKTIAKQSKPSQANPGMHILDRKVIKISLNSTNVTGTALNASSAPLRSSAVPSSSKKVKSDKSKPNDKKPKETILKYDSRDNAKVNNSREEKLHMKEKHEDVKFEKVLTVQRTDTEDENARKKVVPNNSCKRVDTWGQKYNADLSTYDLFRNVSYKMDSEGKYPIPVRSIEEIKQSENLKPLTVVLVPFSHADPGYGLTLEQYYQQMTHDTLNNMVTKLMQYPNMTFQWAETVFLARWFEDLDAGGRDIVKKLTQNGQLEIVLGGWVMPDEASTNYVGVVDQLIEGHQWLLENLGVKPKSAWVNDPFGYSSTMPYLWKSSGMDNLLFLRINQPVKAKLMKMKSLEFMWRPYWKTSNESDVLSSLMSYTNYWVSDVCGPVQENCQEFNFLHLYEEGSKAVEVTDSNVAEQARKLSEQFRITGDLYKYNTLYIGLGEDFSYPKAHQWDNMYKNYEKLSNFINSQKTWNMTVKFGTLTEYFTRIRNEERKLAEYSENSRSTASQFPTLSGDFFPYTEREQEFWTGYFTTRPLNKRFSREIESLIRSADIFNVVVYSLFKYYGVKFTAYEAVAGRLRTARRELGMFMHHDGITGTSLPHVVADYEDRLFKANEHAHAALKMAILSLLSKGKQHNPKLLQEEIVKPGTRKMAGNLVIDTSKEAQLILINSVARRRKEVINIFANSKEVEIASPSKKNIPYQITIRTENSDNLPFVISFEAELPALGIERYTLQPKDSFTEKIEVYERLPAESDNIITIENAYMKVEFEKDTGMLKRIIHTDSHVTNITAKFMVYQSKTSGAYIFGPAGPAQAFMAGTKTVKVTKGPLFSEVKVTSSGFLLSVKLYNTSGIFGHGIHVKTEVDMSAVKMKEMEVILRFQTDVQNGDYFYTDQNGFQLIGRENRPTDKIESNYYPVTTMAVLEDKIKRFTMHCKQPHGGASLKSGQFEVMLDRHTLRDDKRGLGQGVYDNVRVNSDFIIHIEHKTQPFKPEEIRYTYPSADSVLMNDLLQNSAFKYIQQDSSLSLLEKVHPLKSTEFPCDVSIVGLRNIVNNDLEYNSTSLVLHRKPLHCGYLPKNRQCSDNNRALTIKNIFPKLKVKISETSLSHLHTKKLLNVDSDITPDVHELRAFKIHL